MKKFISNSKGSILMEAVIIMPLYMLLFGGMMLVGDMVLGGVNLYNANRMLAWIAMDRFGVNDDFLVQQAQSRFNNNDDSWVFDETQKPKTDWAGYYKQSGGEYVTINNYLALFKGSMPLKMNKIPMLYQGLLAVNDVMNRPDEVIAENKDLLYKTVFDLGKDEWFAHYLVKRRPNVTPDRNASGAELVVSNSWIDIISDNWIKRQDTASTGLDSDNNNDTDNVTDDDLQGYTQGLEAFAGAIEQ